MQFVGRESERAALGARVPALVANALRHVRAVHVRGRRIASRP